mmetsp:Transcript_19580/g.42263  ORF Transcript_19580/g.42263 Transcript_19580/m.42263 type:complete len:110 (+) Transcript_19580:3-332(+)
MRNYERQLLRNLTEWSAIVRVDSSTTISEEAAWVIALAILLVSCCCCPLTCLYCQLKQRAKERQLELDLMWSRQVGQDLAASKQAKMAASQQPLHLSGTLVPRVLNEDL